MSKTTSPNAVLGRRVVLRMIGATGLAAGGTLALLGGCGSKEGGEGSAKAGAAGDCNTVPDADSKNLRKTMQYKPQSDIPDKMCSNCAQYTPNAYGDCGSCKLFTGPVQPKGYCISYAPIGGAASAAPKASG